MMQGNIEEGEEMREALHMVKKRGEEYIKEITQEPEPSTIIY